MEKMFDFLLKNTGGKRSDSVVLNNEDFIFFWITCQVAEDASCNVPKTIDNIWVATDDDEAVGYKSVNDLGVVLDSIWQISVIALN